jgi:hypothetical protein
MLYRSREITEIELDRETEKFRLSSLGCEGYTVGVCAALLFMVSVYTGKTPQEIGGLSGQQLWELVGAGFKTKLKILDLPKPVDDYLCTGEQFAIRLGLYAFSKTLPTGGCLGEIFDSAEVDIAKLNGLVVGDSAI